MGSGNTARSAAGDAEWVEAHVRVHLNHRRFGGLAERQTSSVSVRKTLKNSAKQCQTMKGEIPGQPANQLVTDGSGSSSHG
jgi:hypothetical protein